MADALATRVRPTGAHGEYDVIAAGGVRIGQVRKRVERFNLRRPVTVTSWVAYGLDSRSVDGVEHRLRRHAVAAVEEAARARLSE